jgi:hypothetical protein
MPSDQSSQLPYGICQTLLLLPMLENVCSPGSPASLGPKCHSHLCSAELTRCQHYCWALLLLLLNVTMSTKPCWHYLPGTTEDHLQCDSCHLFLGAAGKECTHSLNL